MTTENNCSLSRSQPLPLHWTSAAMLFSQPSLVWSEQTQFPQHLLTVRASWHLTFWLLSLDFLLFLFICRKTWHLQLDAVPWAKPRKENNCGLCLKDDAPVPINQNILFMIPCNPQVFYKHAAPCLFFFPPHKVSVSLFPRHSTLDGSWWNSI